MNSRKSNSETSYINEDFNGLVAGVKKAIIEYVETVDENSFKDNQSFSLDYFAECEIPTHRMQDIRQLTDILAASDKTRDFLKLGNDIYDYTQGMQTGVNFGLFRFGGFSRLKNNINVVLRQYQPILFVGKSHEDVLEHWKMYYAELKRLESDLSSSMGQISNLDQAFKQNNVIIKELEDAIQKYMQERDKLIASINILSKNSDNSPTALPQPWIELIKKLRDALKAATAQNDLLHESIGKEQVRRGDFERMRFRQNTKIQILSEKLCSYEQKQDSQKTKQLLLDEGKVKAKVVELSVLSR